MNLSFVNKLSTVVLNNKDTLAVGAIALAFGEKWRAVGAAATYLCAKKIYQSGQFFGLSQSDVQKAGDHHYFAKKGDDLTFCMTRLTDENFPVWSDLFNWAKRGHGFNDNWSNKQKSMFLDVEQGATAFRNTLSMFEEQKHEIWISYVLSGKDMDPSKPIDCSHFPNIEMAMTVLTNPGVPFALHFGIARTTHNLTKIFDGEMPKHPDLSLQLHGFSAKALLKSSQGKKQWLVTSPTRPMAKILDTLPNVNVGKDKMPVQYENGKLSVRNKHNVVIFQADSKDPSVGFYNHSDMSQLEPYAVPYQELADSFKL